MDVHFLNLLLHILSSLFRSGQHPRSLCVRNVNAVVQCEDFGYDLGRPMEGICTELVVKKEGLAIDGTSEYKDVLGFVLLLFVFVREKVQNVECFVRGFLFAVFTDVIFEIS